MERLLTPFGEKMDKKLPLNDYPRPQLTRDSFENLNGEWDYAILPKTATLEEYQGKILVPFSPECILSGVEKVVTPDDVLYYRRKFNFEKQNDRALLHFGAVDYECQVAINGKTVGSHKGGYYPFTFDITDALVSGENEITVTVTDPTDKGSQARGKQSSKRGGIWYTPQSGIWQTVWIEQVCDNYITKIKLTPDIDLGTVDVEVFFAKETEVATVEVFDKEHQKAVAEIKDGKVTVDMGEFKCWSPENPYLYDLKIKTSREEVGSYFGMRKFGIGKSEKGFPCLTLNNKPYFHNGLLDQGYWSDGMYTPPTDEALIYDIQTMKDMGFNMLRKHIKIEPLRWYYHCDRLGMLVWQDMISGGSVYNIFATTIQPAVNLGLCSKKFGAKDTEKKYKFFSRTDEEGRKEYYVDSERMIDELYNVVSLSVWVPFNEGWGQFDSAKAYEFYKEKDPTRIIDHASGFHDQGCGDLNSFHIYFTPFKFPKFNRDDNRPIALTEFGGYGLRLAGHAFNMDRLFGYRVYKTEETFVAALEKLYTKRLVRAINRGLCATVYTEVSDVEDEVNGLLTYDRKVAKISVEKMKELNSYIKL